MKEEQELLQEAVAEIKRIRKQNELMSARLEMFDMCMMLIHTEPARQSQGMSIDLVWKIEKHIESTKKEQ